MMNYSLGLPRGEKFNKKSYEELISNIPNPREVQEYESMWSVLKILHSLIVSDEAKSHLFRSVEGNWTDNKSVINKEFSDKLAMYSEAVAQDILLPAYIAEFNKFAQQSSSGRIPDVMIRFNNDFVSDVRSELASLVKEVIASNSKAREIVDCHERLDRRAGEILESKPILKKKLEDEKDIAAEFKPEWHELFPPQTIEMPDGSYHFRCLNSNAELNVWAKKLGNCLHTFDTRCNAGVCHIILGLTPSGSEFVVRLNNLQVSEIEFADRKPCTVAVNNAAKYLATEIAVGKIAINANKGALDFNRTIEEVVGFEVRDAESVKAVYDAYQSAKILPKFLQELSREDFLERSGFQNFFAQKKYQHRVKVIENPSASVLKPNISAAKKSDLLILDVR